MAVWFARTTGNINTVNKWNSAADGSGSWLTWPPASGDVLMANGIAITINVNTNLGATGQLRNDTASGATAGGLVTIGNGISLTANVFAGVSSCIFSSSATGFIVGSITGGSASGSYGVNYQGTGTLTITGDVNGGSGANGVGVYNHTSGGTINITGTLRSSVNNSGAIYNAGSGTVNVTGDVIGMTVSGAQAYTALNNSTGTINITGNAIAGVGEACRNNAGGTLTVSGYAQASTTSAALNNVAQGVLQVGETRSASNGLGAVTSAFRFASATAAKTMPYTPDGQISMTVLDVAAIVPAESDVRKGLVFGDGAYTGTLQLGRNRTSMAGRF
jgi:hypothetical protein